MVAALGMAAAWGQTLPVNPLQGKYHVRHLLAVHAGGVFQDQRSLAGIMEFDGNGRFTITGTQRIGAGADTAFSTSGAYSVELNGTVTLANPQRAGVQIQARVGRGMLVGSSVEAGGGLYDLLAAVPAATGLVQGSVTGDYRVAGIEFVNAASPISRATFFTVRPSQQAQTVSVTGQASNLGTRPVTQTIGNVTVNVSADGSGGAAFPAVAGTPAGASLLNGAYSLAVAAGTNAILLAPQAAGAHGLFVGAKADSGGTVASVQDLYWTAGMQVNGTRPNSHVGAAKAGEGVMTLARRVRTPDGPVDFSGVNRFSIDSGGLGFVELNRLSFGGNRTLFVSSGVSTVDANNFELVVGVRAAAETIPANGPFVSAYGAVNAASFAPPGNPASPGGFLTLFGARLAEAMTVAGGLPFPTSLGGVQVLVNGTPAPLYFVSPGQISLLVPYATAAGTARVVAVVNGVRAPETSIRVASTSPGVFSLGQSGYGPGAILKADYSVVSAANRARRGDVVQVYLTGLGAVTPAVNDGAAAGASPLSLVPAVVNVYVGGVKARVDFKGLAPGFAGLYQLNVRIPDGAPGGANVPLAIETPDAFHDQVDIAIAP